MASAPIGVAHVKIVPDIGDMSILTRPVMITLTHAIDVDGRFMPLDPYTGRTVVDARRIEAIEEVVHPTKGTVSYVTMQSSQSHTVAETVDQIAEAIAAAFED